MSKTNPKIDALLGRAKWQEERKKLRAILLDCQLTEEVKWGKLCYTFQGGNVAIFFGLKAYCGVGFLKGSLLSDPEAILASQGENSQAMRMIRATSVGEIDALEPVIRAYVKEAIEIEKAGLKVDFKEKNELILPKELEDAFEDLPELRTAFRSLTPGRQRGYVLHFAGAKQSKTRASRVEKWIPQILDGKGMNDR